MMQRASILCLLSAIATACSTSSKPDATNTQNAVEPAPNPFPDAPPNSPPPAATCGDMNGGGDQHVDFPGLLAAKIAEKTEAERRQLELLDFRYDLSDVPAPNVTMSRGKAIQQGVRAKLAAGLGWADLAQLSPEQIREQDLFPAGFLPLPHPKQPEGGMLFPQSTIDEVLRQTGRNLTRFDRHWRHASATQIELLRLCHPSFYVPTGVVSKVSAAVTARLGVIAAAPESPPARNLDRLSKHRGYLGLP